MRAHKYHHPGFREFVVKRKARKEHDCGECRMPIHKGEEYYSDNFGGEHHPMGSGYPHQYYTHKVCERCWRGKKLWVGATPEDWEPEGAILEDWKPER